MCVPEEKTRELEVCVRMFGWVRRSEMQQFLANGDSAQPEILFCNDSHKCSVFTLNPLVDPKRGHYSAWGVYCEGTLTEWGNDVEELLACLSKSALAAA